MSTAPDVSVLVVNWNAGQLLADCVDSVAAGLEGLRGEIVVVDNDSTDDSLARLQPRPDLRVVRRGDNAGFAAGTNQAAALASGRYLLLLNPDAACMPGAIRRLVAFLEEHPEAGAVGPRLLNTDGSPQRSCWFGYPDLGSALVDALYLWKLPRLPLARESEPDPQARLRTLAVDHLLGACILTPRAVWDRVGALDEGYFLFLEETDWCRRVRGSGLKVYYEPSATVVHHGEHSVYQVPTSSLPAYYRSYARFRRRSGAGAGEMIALKAVFALAACVRLFLWGARYLVGDRALARRMVRGYGRVLGEIPAY